MLGAIIRKRLLLLQGFICNWINLWFGFALYTLRGVSGRWRSWLRSMNVLKSSRSLELVLEDTGGRAKQTYYKDAPALGVSLTTPRIFCFVLIWILLEIHDKPFISTSFIVISERLKINIFSLWKKFILYKMQIQR